MWVHSFRTLSPATARSTDSVLPNVHTGTGVRPLSYSLTTGGLYPEVKRPGLEADHSPPSSVKFKNNWNIPPFILMPYVSMAWRGIISFYLDTVVLILISKVNMYGENNMYTFTAVTAVAVVTAVTVDAAVTTDIAVTTAAAVTAATAVTAFTTVTAATAVTAVTAAIAVTAFTAAIAVTAVTVVTAVTTAATAIAATAPTAVTAVAVC